MRGLASEICLQRQMRFHPILSLGRVIRAVDIGCTDDQLSKTSKTECIVHGTLTRGALLKEMSDDHFFYALFMVPY